MQMMAKLSFQESWQDPERGTSRAQHDVGRWRMGCRGLQRPASRNWRQAPLDDVRGDNSPAAALP